MKTDQTADPKKIENISSFNQIEFRNVTYAHTKDENKLFENMNLKFLNGEKVCIFGQSGSGKTTFLNLISGFIKPQSGKILLDNEDISISNNDLLDHVSYVSQNVFLLHSQIFLSHQSVCPLLVLE